MEGHAAPNNKRPRQSPEPYVDREFPVLEVNFYSTESEAMNDEPLPNSEIILYQTEDGRTRIQCRFENETVWLSQKLMAELFGKDVRTFNEHIQNVFSERELVADSVIRKFRITAADGCVEDTPVFRKPICF